MTRIYRIIKLIEETDTASEILNDPVFNSEIQNNRKIFENALDYENLYGKGRYQIAKYVIT